MTNFTASDHQYMAQALRLAQQGLYSTTPNPRVGCVIVNNDTIVGEGAHLKAGTPHAEVHALNQASKHADGATVYVSLEPCSHEGKTPPCAQALVEAKVAKVIIAMQDPNPLVAGAGVAYLKANGIQVTLGLMEKQAMRLNAGFVKRMCQQQPLVRSKIAASLDGKTALNNGVSQWITGDAARADVQKWRGRSCAILTGAGTVLADNPSLNVRDETVTQLMFDRQPLKVVVDSQLRTPLDARILQTGHTLIAYAADHQDKASDLIAKGVELLCIPNGDGKVCLKTLLNHLANNEVNEVMVEGGEGLNGALMALGLIDELVIYYASKLMGSQAKGMFDFPALTKMDETVKMTVQEVRQFGSDIRIHTILEHST